MHTPPLHESEATFALEHPRLHPPQLLTFALVLVSQPSSAVGAVGWLQFPNPELQVELQVPPLHDRAATLADEHARPHCPQLSTLVFVLTSQPSSAVGAAGWLQFPKPELHVEVHRPPLHASEATLAPEQARPQAPQLLVFVLVFTSQPSSAAG